jgi:predicted RNA-binding protein YlxR (DUF448 family)
LVSTTRHIPQRTCAGCRTTSSKREFVRVVRTPEGTVEVDESGRRNGRGAYLCAQASCWQAALQRDRLGRALRTTISTKDAEALRSYAERYQTAAVVS